MTEVRLRAVSSVLLVGLIVLAILWEGWLSPLRPGGSMLILKVVPLMAAFFGVIKGRRYTYQWLSMLILLYVTEGVVRAFDPGLGGALALIEAVLAIALFLCTLVYCRITAPSRHKAKGAAR